MKPHAFKADGDPMYIESDGEPLCNQNYGKQICAQLYSHPIHVSHVGKEEGNELSALRAENETMRLQMDAARDVLKLADRVIDAWHSGCGEAHATSCIELILSERGQCDCGGAAFNDAVAAFVAARRGEVRS